MSEFQVKRKVKYIEIGTIEAESHAQAADMLRSGMWGDVVRVVRNDEYVSYKLNGLPIYKIEPVDE